MPDDLPQECPAWRAYALMLWPCITTFGNREAVLDAEGEPVCNETGEPKTEWKSLNIKDMTERTIHHADLLYAAEMKAERRLVCGDPPVRK